MHRKSFFIALVLYCGTLVAPTAHAVPLRFDFSSTCAFNCPSYGLTNGDPISAFFVLESDTFTFSSSGPRYNVRGPSGVLDFGVSIGNFQLNPSNTFGISILAQSMTSRSPSVIDDWQMTISQGTGPSATGFGGILTGASIPRVRVSRVGTRTYCFDSDVTCAFVFVSRDGAGEINSFGGATGVPVPPAVVPLPASALLLVMGFAGLGLVARRKRFA